MDSVCVYLCVCVTAPGDCGWFVRRLLVAAAMWLISVIVRACVSGGGVRKVSAMRLVCVVRGHLFAALATASGNRGFVF